MRVSHEQEFCNSGLLWRLALMGFNEILLGRSGWTINVFEGTRKQS